MKTSGVIIALCYFLVHLDTVRGLQLSEFYPYGPAVGDRTVPRKDEGATDEVELQVPFVFYGITYFSFFINVNGIISFLTEIPYFFNSQFPLDYPVIAPFYSDVDLTGTGNIWYRETRDQETLQSVDFQLKRNFESASQFQPSSVSIITYEAVGAYQARRDKVNTFQVILITNAEDSFIILNYAAGGLQWMQGDGKTSGLPDAIGQAGFVAADGRLFTLRGSGTDQVRNLDKWSNVGEPGIWMFRVGQIEEGKNIQTPSLAQILDGFDGRESCVTGGATCHSSGSCIDYEEGFCCECPQDSYGNGLNCIKKEAPIRVTGKMSGNINGFDIIEGSLHSYVLATEGRTYTAVSRIPKEVGFDLQSMTGIGEGIAWLFAIPKEGVPNGFSLTGGVFNRSVKVTFPQTGHQAEIQQNFEGLDVFNNVAVTTTISGSLPTIPVGSELEVDSFKEEFTRVGAGQMRARSTRSFKMKGKTLNTPYSVETFIHFVECKHAPRDPQIDTLRFKVAENIFIRFDEAESIVRFSFSAKIGNLEEEDPCIKGREACGQNSQCIVDGDNFRCVCEQGYDYVYNTEESSTPICLDMNECDSGRALCDSNAICINNPGSYSCQCNVGFSGDGYYCRDEFTCENAGCDPNASCDDIGGKPICRCNVGYTGDGFFCSPDFGDESCLVSRDCSPYAVCTPNGNDYVCKCLEGYVGDGYHCTMLPSPINPIFRPFHPKDLRPRRPFRPRVPVRQEDVPIKRPLPIPLTPPTVIKPSRVQPECIREVCLCPDGYLHNKQTWECELQESSPTDNFVPVNPYPQCGGDNPAGCTCPEGFTYNENIGLCDAFVEVQIAPVCYEGTCLCPFGYVILPNSNECRPTQHPDFDYSIKYSASSCNVINNCHANAQCLYLWETNEHKCTCNAGFTGDGYSCFQVEVSCDQVDICHVNADCIFSDLDLRSVCICKVGYSGDGLVCTPQDDCSETDDCDINAQCLFEPEFQRYTCICNEGYKGSGFFCAADIPDESCATLDNCDINADCVPAFDSFACQCKEGFEGDGYFCRVVQLGCNILHNCGQNAECAYDKITEGFQCQCMQGFTGDGFYCETIQTCLLEPTICDPQATCERSTIDQFSAACVCRFGYIGNGYNCEKTPDHEKNILLLNQGLSILRMPINKELSNGFPILVDPYMTAVGADIDCLTGRYYWTDVGSRSIRSCRYDGTEKIPVISGKSGSPEDVAVDWISRIIYWTDSLNDIVAVADIEGNKVRTIIKDDLVNPRGITLHPGLGLLFWSDWNRINPKIEVSAMDGSNRRPLVTGSEISLPNSLVIDYETTALCWADAGTYKIECIGVDGYGRRVIIEGIKYPFGLALHQDTFYYTDWNDTSIHEVNKYSGMEEGIRRPPPGGSGKLYGIVSVPEQCPPVSNVCQIGNGGCRGTHLCLPNGGGGRTCACPDEGQNNLGDCIDYSY